MEQQPPPQDTLDQHIAIIDDMADKLRRQGKDLDVLHATDLLRAAFGERYRHIHDVLKFPDFLADNWPASQFLKAIKYVQKNLQSKRLSPVPHQETTVKRDVPTIHLG